jgi:hypothetical protein
MINKTVHNAINELINQYENNKHTGKTSDCPLCLIFFNDDCCKGCPNTAFSDDLDCPCVDRTRNYNNLNWTKKNFPNLIEFWKQVNIIIPDNDKKYYLNNFTKNQIVFIAYYLNIFNSIILIKPQSLI